MTLCERPPVRGIPHGNFGLASQPALSARAGRVLNLILPRKITAQRFLHHPLERHVVLRGQTAAILKLRRGIANHAVKAADLDPDLSPWRGYGDVLPLPA